MGAGEDNDELDNKLDDRLDDELDATIALLPVLETETVLLTLHCDVDSPANPNTLRDNSAVTAESIVHVVIGIPTV